MDDDDDCLDSLRRERRLPLRGNPLEDWNPDRFERQMAAMEWFLQQHLQTLQIAHVLVAATVVTPE
jgi:hypothetical protein